MVNQLQCTLCPLGSFGQYKYVVVCTFYNGKMVLSKHKNRQTWEHQGGHVEYGETPIQAAQRELFEESGVLDFDIFPMCDYVGASAEGQSNGQVFVAIAKRFGKMPNFEMQQLELFDSLPTNLTYPHVTPIIFEQARKFLATLNADIV